MSLNAELQNLGAQTARLHEALVGLRMTVVEDRPLRGDAILLDALGDAAEDLLGWLEEARAAINESLREENAADPHHAPHVLTACQERFNRITQRFSSDLVSYETVAELVRLGHERGGEWRVWAASVKDALDRCQQRVYDVHQAFFQCWREIAERVGTTSVSVRATNIGQQVTVPTNQELVPEGIG